MNKLESYNISSNRILSFTFPENCKTIDLLRLNIDNPASGPKEFTVLVNSYGIIFKKPHKDNANIKGLFPHGFVDGYKLPPFPAKAMVEISLEGAPGLSGLLYLRFV